MSLLLVSFGQKVANGKSRQAMPFPPSAVLSVEANSLGIAKNARIIDFSISPDGAEVTAGFEISGSEKHLTLWLGEWELKAGSLIAKAELDKPIAATAGVGFSSFFHPSIEYSPDGSKIIVRAGNNVYGLQSSNLATLYSFSPGNKNDTSSDSPFEQVFSISEDGGSLAVLAGQSEFPSRLGTVYIYDANTGREKVHWSAPAQISNLCLSQNGNHVLLTVAHYSADILLADSSSGRIIKSFVSGFENGAGQSAGALFLDEYHFVASPIPRTNAKDSPAARVFELVTGDLTAQLLFEQSGWPQNIWLSNKSSMIAALKTTPLKKHLSFAEGGGSENAQIAFFHLNETRPFCTLGPLPEKPDKPFRTSGFVRMSPDLKIVGLFMENKISLYSTSECTSSDGQAGLPFGSREK
jgi:hypothetical protein